MSLRIALGHVIREERMRQEVTLETLGERSGVARETVLRTETSDDGLMLETLEGIAAGLGLPVSFLVARAEARGEGDNGQGR